MSTMQSNPRFGVEEEFLVIDPTSRDVAPAAGAVVARAKAALGARVSGEFTHLQLETRTGICTTLKEMLGQLMEARSVVDACARQEGLRIVSTGTPVLAGAVPPPITEGARQDLGNAAFRGLHDEQAICALHVHVEMPDRELAVKVSNQLRPQLPVLISLAANSPFWAGRDTGYAGWRTLVWSRWPIAGPPPVFASAAHYDELVETMLAAGALVDRGTVFWDVRPSDSHPTLEVRVADAQVTAQDAALLAALIRALVVHAARAVERGEPDPVVAPELMRMAYWRAARDGLDGSGFDLSADRLVPAVSLAERLIETVRPILAGNGDDELVDGWWSELLAGGGGAARQRAAARRGDPADVVDDLIVRTAPQR